MVGFIVRRTLSAVLVVVLTSMAVFTLFYKGPDNPAIDLCYRNGHCTPEKAELLKRAMGYDEPLPTAYGTFVKGLFVDRVIYYGAQYDCPAPCLGISFSTREPVTGQLVTKYPATVTLALGGATIYLVLGVLTGALAARRRGSAADRLLVSSTLIISSIPYYLFALLAWIFLVLKLKLFPETGYFPITQNPLKTFTGMLLPWLCIGLTSATAYARFSRGSMVETLSEDYVRTATAKGVRRSRVVFRHALRAAIVPVVTIFGLDLASLLAGTIFTEHIFDIDGIGQWSISSIRSPIDFPVLNATILLSAVLIVVANLVVDIMYSFLDPRVRVS